MTDEEYENYHKERYEPALSYYDPRAQRYKRGHYLCSVFVLVVSVFVAVAQGFSECIKTIASVFAPTIALVSGLAAIYRCHEEWLSARTTWDALRHEKFWRDAKVGPYESSTDKNAPTDRLQQYLNTLKAPIERFDSGVNSLNETMRQLSTSFNNYAGGKAGPATVPAPTSPAPAPYTPGHVSPKVTVEASVVLDQSRASTSPQMRDIMQKMGQQIAVEQLSGHGGQGGLGLETLA